MNVTWRLCAGLSAALFVSGCATTSPVLRQECYDPDAQLAAVMVPLEAQRAQGCGTGDCRQLESEVGRLAMVCSGHVPTLMANALIAYDQHQPIVAQQFLDDVLARARVHPDAAVLRSRIALEEGNLPFARRLLGEQIKLTPDNAALREAHGAVLYFDRQWTAALGELSLAAELGAPRWRIAYHRGLVAEGQGDLEAARRYYTESVSEQPGFAPAQSRLRGLRGTR